MHTLYHTIQTIITFTLLFAYDVRLFAQEADPCGVPPANVEAFSKAVLWKYSLDDYAADLAQWLVHPWVHSEVIGQSVQGRPLTVLKITGPNQKSKRRVWIHARTHPNEAESSLVTKAIIDELLSGSALAGMMMYECEFDILPMYNPDGVALQKARENANGVDIESNWNTIPPQPEVAALRAYITELMAQTQPVEVALNMHSAWECKRYFVYHDVGGTSEIYTQLEQQFIGMVRSRFIGGFEPYTFFVTWKTGTPLQYPESWYWTFHAEKVMALTYEDMNCEQSGDFDKTARAILGGIGEYMKILGPVSDVTAPLQASTNVLAVAYPNPFGAGSLSRQPSIRIRLAEEIRNTSSAWKVEMFDVLGRSVTRIHEGALAPGQQYFSFTATDMPSGSYFLRVANGDRVQMLLIQFVQ